MSSFTQRAIAIIFVFTILVGGTLSKTAVSADPPATRTGTLAADVDFSPLTLPAGTTDELHAAADGLRLQSGALEGSYLSPILTAPVPFNALFPQWEADLPEGADFHLEIRTVGKDDLWQEWQEIHASDDWTRPSDPDIVGEMVLVPGEGITHNRYQFRLELTGDAAVHSLRFSFVDSTFGGLNRPAPESTVPSPDNAFPKPNVVGRDTWCIDSDCSCTINCDPCVADDDLYYEPVTHMVIHHTVSSNSSTNWEATVRAIWYFHTYTRCWGDIGYNYLIDMDGTIYEGHRGGDDISGTHASAANTGSMGVSLIGTFTLPNENPPGITPPQPMLSSLIDLLAWKADQKEIDVYDAGKLPWVDWGLPTIMGHRDVYGGTATTCPGDQVHALIPWIREQVADRLDFETPYIFFDSYDNNAGTDTSYFHKSAATWYVTPKGCGWNRHAYYTWSTTDPGYSTNTAHWHLDIPRDGRYQVFAYFPYCDINSAETMGANYTVQHASGQDSVIINQKATVGLWTLIGEYDLTQASDPQVYLSDLTTTDDWDGVMFDSLRILYLDPYVVNEAPVDGLWTNELDHTFSWEPRNTLGIISSTVEFAANSSFTDTLYSEIITSTAVTLSHTFLTETADIYWRVQIVISPSQELIISDPTWLGFDLAVPVSSVDTVGQNNDFTAFTVDWSGIDNESGIAGYNLDLRAADTISWSRWLTATTLTATTFVPPDNSQIYWFRTQAVDNVGNVQPLSLTIPISSSTPLAPAIIDMAPDANWSYTQTVMLQWTNRNILSPLTTTVTIATDSAMSNTLTTAVLTGTQTSFTTTFNLPDQTLYWQVTIQTALSETILSPIAAIQLDTTPPDIAIDRFMQSNNGNISQLRWSGTDSGSGISHYDIAIRPSGTLTWTQWMSATNDTEIFFVDGTGSDYQFMITAVDFGGHARSIIPASAAIFPNSVALPLIVNP